MRLNIIADCGNSPKREFLKDLTIHLASYNLDQVLAHMDEDICWTLQGDKPVRGIESFRETLLGMNHDKPIALSIHQIITHGKDGAVKGEVEMKDGQVIAFADFYTFASAGSKRIKSFDSFIAKIR